jgi:chromosome segregation ATPase
MPKPLEIYEELKTRIGEREAKDLVEFIQESVEKGAATKEDISKLREATAENINALKEEIGKLRTETKEEIGKLRNETKEDIHRLERLIGDTEVRLIKWMFGIWVSNVALISGIIYAIIRATIK